VGGHPLTDSALMWIVTSASEVGMLAARQAKQILQGMKPANLPVETPEFSVVLNLETARAIDLEIPDIVLRLAGRVIR